MGVCCNIAIASLLSPLNSEPKAALVSVVKPDNLDLSKQLQKQLDEFRKQQGKHLSTFVQKRNERDYLTALLRAGGYYDATITTHSNTDDLAHWSHEIKTGPLFHIAEVRFDFPEAVASPTIADLGLALGQVLDAVQVNNAEAKLRKQLSDNACLFDINLSQMSLLDRNTALAELVFTLKPSRETVFGEIQFDGLDHIKPRYIQRIYPVDKGMCFSRPKLDEARLALLQTGLIARIDQQFGSLNTDSEPAVIDILVNIQERRRRTNSVGIAYNTDSNLGFSLNHQNRNLWGGAEQLDAGISTNSLRDDLDLALTLPNFYHAKQSLLLKSLVSRETTDAYDSDSAELSARLNRDLDSQVSVFAGASISTHRIDENNITTRSRLFAFPVGGRRDTRNDVLDAYTGTYISLALSPYFNLDTGALSFTQWTSELRWYKAVASDDTVLAVRTALGSTSGSSLAKLPADKRFYVGGGGSVRGYDYQSLSRSSDGEPDGGLSFAETSVELRHKFANSWGVAVFVDGGYAYDDVLPSFGHNFHYSAGLGLRYLTGFAPIRLDVATPLQDAPGNSNIHLYFSIGQAY